MILADLPAPTPASTWQFFLVVAAVSGVLVNIVTIFFLLGNRKERREVSFTVEPASKEEFEKLVIQNRHEHENIFSKIGGVERGADAKMAAMMKESNEGREKIHKRINEVLAGVSRLEGKLEGKTVR